MSFGPWTVLQDVSDAIGKTSSGQPYAAKWPRLYKRVVPDPSLEQTIEEAFAWPVKAKRNLEILKAGIKPDCKPALLSGRTLTLSSNFSGICSQSRGARILENHSFGSFFRHVQSSVLHVVPTSQARTHIYTVIVHGVAWCCV